MGKKTNTSLKTELQNQMKEDDYIKLVERLNLATNAAQMGIWDWDIQKNELIWDDQMYKLYGLRPGDFGGAYEAWLNGVHPDDRAPSNEVSQQAMRGEKEYDTEFRVLWPDGSIHWLKANGQVFRDEKGNPLRMVGVNYDITARRQAEERLKESEEYLRLGYEAGDLGVWKNDLQTGAVEFDERARIHYGFDTLHTTLSEVINRIHPDDLARVGSEIEAATSPDGSGKFSTEYRVVHADGSVHWLAIGVRVMFEGEGAQRHPVIGYGTTQNITERKLADEKLRQSEERFSTLFRSHPVPVGITRQVDYRIVDVNDAWTNLTGYTRDEAIGHTSTELGLVKPEILQQVREMLRDREEINQYEVSICRRSGQERLVLLSSEPIQLGSETYLLNNLLDISDRKQAEEALKESEAQFSKVFFTNPVSQSILSATTGQVVEVNDACCRLYEYSREELIGTDPGNLNLWTNLAERLEVLEELQSTGHVIAREIMIRPKSGETRTILFSVEQISWKREPCLITSSVDITERTKAEYKVQRQMQHLNGLHTIDLAISSSMEMGSTLNVILQQTLNLLNADAVSILLFNDLLQRLEYATSMGFHSASVSRSQTRLGEGLAGQVGLNRELLHIPDLVQIGDKFLRAEMLKEDQFVEYYGVPLVAKDSLKGVLEIFNRTPLNPDSEWLNFLETLGGQAAIAIDNAQLFKELQQSNAELEQRVKLRTADLLLVNAELEHANRAKDEFLANMSHELRTPLTGILGFSEALQLNTYGQLSEKQVIVLKNIETSGQHLLALINDILDLSKIEAGKFDIYPEMINLKDACRASLMFVKEQALKKNILLEYQGTEDAISVFADPRRLKQILINLLSNAIKFTPEKGSVTLAVRADSEQRRIHFSVIDTGIGIARDDMDHLFTPFTQVDSRLNREYEGTGLGLVLVLRLAEMHGGNVQVETEPGKGSTFTVSLPWQSQIVSNIEFPDKQASVQNLEAHESNSRGVLLLAEDNPTNIQAIGDFLQFQGFTLVIASNGMEALIKAEESDPRLILMDVQMPVMDGLEAMRRLRADPRFTSTPIIALTALAMTGDRDRCLEAGADDYLSKPVSLKELVEKIEKLLHQ